MFSQYIRNKSKNLIVLRKFVQLNKLIIRLQKRRLNISLLFWFLDNEIICPPATWEKVFQLFNNKCILFPIVIRRTSPKFWP